MKALVLAAGFGTRLSPFTQVLPKALFPVAGIPVLERTILYLKQAGCRQIAVNAHHLADQIQSFVRTNTFGVPIHVSHEPEILGTGGAIRNLEAFWDTDPFVVINTDIITDIDLKKAYRDHVKSGAKVSLLMHDHPPFNQVWVDEKKRIAGFKRYSDVDRHKECQESAFTGIHIMDKEILRWIPAGEFCDIISIYQKMLDEGRQIHACTVSAHYWKDMGTPKRFRDAVIDEMAPGVFRSVFSGKQVFSIHRRHLVGDGSNRNWFRLTCEKNRLILADHGITPQLQGSEFNAFVKIGTHLSNCGIPVPQIHAHDAFSGLVFMEDLGNRHLQQEVKQLNQIDKIEVLYKKAIDTLFDLTEKACDGFDPSWTCQSPYYDIPLILDKECRYFIEAFINGYLGMNAAYEDIEPEFKRLARWAIDQGVNGLIHRDFQSRNIMMKNGTVYLIDFQGARFGLIQYDLASLLIDPYVQLDSDLKNRLLNYSLSEAVHRFSCDPDRFIQGFHYCMVTRNLQMLGAFGFLTRVKKKSSFEQWIPAASRMLNDHLHRAGPHSFPKLSAIAKAISSR